MRTWPPRGFTTAELLVVAAVLGVLAATAVPIVVGWRTSSLRAGAEELKALLNAARHLAVAENTTVCVSGTAAGVRLIMGGCTGMVWTGPGVNHEGVIPLTSRVRIAAASPVVFTYLGAAAPAGSYTLEASHDRASIRVVVSASGRIAVAR
jgi:prepilin-type N-terminal cleavage/methylation domain-containing protein